MRFKKNRTTLRANTSMSDLLNAPMIDPKDPTWGNDFLQAQREMTPVQNYSLSPIEYMIFSGKGPSLLADLFER